MEESNSHYKNQNHLVFGDRRINNHCPSHDRTLNDIKELYDRTGSLDVQVKSVSSNMSLLIKILSGTVVIGAAMLGSIYLSVAKIDKQVATIVTTVHSQEKENARIEENVYRLQERVMSLEMACQTIRSKINDNQKR